MSENVKVGDRVKIVEMDDGLSKLEKGSKGTVKNIDNEQDLIWVDWDNGEKIALIKGIDKYKVIKK
ncbi:MAG: hypothetical protein AYK22_05200 [Thermoplasmatales archaeon SG8-52-3]|nr:MAG: hypothetical protein AYK22_05200 [Thermoplasmatales archaeon SG8-52-3]